MKIDILSDLQDTEVIGIQELKSGKARIDSKNIPYFISLLSKVYSDKEGSVVREITSNCFDAHVKAGKLGEPVFVRLYIDDTGQHYIEFVDQGCGISPEAMDEVFMSLGESDKRESDDFLGAFGLGSKSPFSYTNYFYLITKVDGVEYTYLLNESIEGTTYDCLLESECDTSSNGTTIRVPIKKEDIGVWENAIKSQLKYFTDVFVSGFNVSNNYKIKKFNSFQIREDLFDSYHDKELHVSLGRVTYPINWDTIDEPPIYFNGALTFEINELNVILNREELKYDDKTIKAIKNKLRLFEEEILNIILSKNNLEFDNLYNFFIQSKWLGDKQLQIEVNQKTYLFPFLSFPFFNAENYLPKLKIENELYDLKYNSLIHCFSPNIKKKLTSSDNGRLTSRMLSNEIRVSNTLLEKSYRDFFVYIIKGRKIKKHERSFLNDKFTKHVFEIDVDEIALLLLNKLKIEDEEVELKLPIVREMIINDVLNKNLKNIDDLNIPSIYGRVKRQTKIKSDDYILLFECKNPKIQKVELESQIDIDLYFNKKNVFVYGRHSLTPELKSILNFFNYNINVFYCSKKYFDLLKKYDNVYHIEEVLLSNGQSNFFNIPFVSNIIDNCFYNYFLFQLNERYKNDDYPKLRNFRTCHVDDLDVPDTIKNFVKLYEHIVSNGKTKGTNYRYSLSKLFNKQYIQEQLSSLEKRYDKVVKDIKTKVEFQKRFLFEISFIEMNRNLDSNKTLLKHLTKSLKSKQKYIDYFKSQIN